MARARRLHSYRPVLWFALVALVTASGFPDPNAAEAARARTSRAARSATTRALPDTVLALVGGQRQVTVSGFQRAWRQVAPPARPDSLTPQSARQFLDLLIDKEALAEAASRRGYHLNSQDSSEWLALRDRLTLQAVLDSAFAAVAGTRSGDGPPDRQALGLAARDSAMKRLGVTFERPAIERALAAWKAIPKPSSDSSLMMQIRVMGVMPAVPAAETLAVLARSHEGEFRVADLLASWKRLNPLYRPRIETAEALQSLVENGVFERHLRREAERRHVDQRADVVEELARNREYKHVGYLVNAEVFEKIPADSVTLRGFYDRTRDDYGLPARLRVVRLTAPSEAEAIALTQRIGSRAAAESLGASSRRSGLDYAGEISAESDSALFAAGLAAGTDHVAGPIPTRDGWTVARVMEVIPARLRSYGEARSLVRQRWNEEQSEQRMRALIKRERAATTIQVNEAAMERVGTGGAH